MNLELIATILTAILGTKLVAMIIVNATPTPKDDTIVRKFYTIIEWLNGIISTRAKDKGD
jgi:hypothetical protein